MRAIRGGDILIVDADTAYVQSITPALEQTGHVVHRCTTLADARKMTERLNPDVILCASSLPDGDSQSLCEFVKNNPELPDAQRISFVILAASSGITPDIASFESSAGMTVARGSAFSGSIAERNQITSAATVKANNSSNTASPDDVIFKSISLVDLLMRVQIMLRMRRYLEEITNTVQSLMLVAEGIEEQDRRARGHCKRLSIMALELGMVMGCDEWQLTALERAAYLHDIGKVSIPGALISKAEMLTPREMEIIQSHCVLGEKLCAAVAALKPVLPIIRHHHERSNGTGYPDGLRGEDIPVLAQILSIPDIYDALRMWRPYRPPMSEAQAVAVMRQEVNQGFWNRHIFEAFVTHVLPGLDERLDYYHVLWPPVTS
ncbi:MAG TPA: HD domain-containing phosphohydrolase [Abditibacteriaceae bacterium]